MSAVASACIMCMKNVPEMLHDTRTCGYHEYVVLKEKCNIFFTQGVPNNEGRRHTKPSGRGRRLKELSQQQKLKAQVQNYI